MTTLGICIPTYKRPDFLRRCVESAIESAAGRPIRVFVADDSLTDVNRPVLDALCAAYSFVHVHRNERNLGIDANIQHVVDLCDCDYAWLIGEDDLFLPGAVAAMHDRLQGRDDPFVFSNYQWVTEDHATVLGVASPGAVDGERAAADFIPELLASIGFIGAVLVQRAAWGRTDAAPYLGTYFAHVGRIVDMLAARPVVQISAAPSVANRSQGEDTFTWKKDSFGVFLGFERMCRIAAERGPALAGALQDAAVNYRREHAYLSLKSTFRLRSQGAFDLRQFRVYIAPATTIEPWRKAWLLLLALAPRLLLRPFARAYVALVARRRQGAASVVC
ncbi:glycosyltransferase [Ideonella azotifigens]|uniref:Glycosyltransferase 2-like domain-containing protein n=1 Tax=Ideonella azotifigens TaxID=513160 RepID=A0ABP3V866_9BURK|nr:glycosyltransferase [Ideonella azotifigens]MCD2341585.1 glycosyltransferase [Ideonella azotifigens]